MYLISGLKITCDPRNYESVHQQTKSIAGSSICYITRAHCVITTPSYKLCFAQLINQGVNYN